MANKHMERCSLLLIVREMKIKTAVNYHLTLVKQAIIKNYAYYKHFVSIYIYHIFWIFHLSTNTVAVPVPFLLWMCVFLVTSVMSHSVTPWTVACQAPLSMGLSRQEYWNGLSFPSAKDLPEPEIKSVAPALAGGFFTTEPPGNPLLLWITLQ